MIAFFVICSKRRKTFVKLYEWLSGNRLSPEEVEFKETASMVVETALKSDVAFMTQDDRFIILIEHQSTENPNMALRMLMYYSELLHLYYFTSTSKSISLTFMALS